MDHAQPPVKPIVNIIAGFLGVGKTTAINNLLSQRPTGERWAVVVNEFGDVGIDGALTAAAATAGPGADPGDARAARAHGTADARAHGTADARGTPAADAPDITVREVPGGCICCTAGVGFRDALVRLIRQERPHRILVEPSGAARVGSVLDALRDPGMAGAIDLRTTVTLVDPAHWSSDRHRASDTYRDQIEAADVLLANRGDLSSPEATDRFLREAAELFPPKRAVGSVEHAAVTADTLDLVGDGATGADATRPPVLGFVAIRPLERALHDHGATYRTVGVRIEPTVVFNDRALADWIAEARHRRGVLRVKGVFRTAGQWVAWNATPQEQSLAATSHRRDSRVELVLERGVSDYDEAALEAELRALTV